MRALLYVIGVPGAGKSTVVAQALKDRPRCEYLQPFAHTAYADGLVQLGRQRAGHSGTDSLSMSVQPAVLAALDVGLWPRLLGEGDRLANTGFFTAATNCGYQLDVVLIDTPLELAVERRRRRDSHQQESWIAGRATKVARLAEQWATWVLDGTRPIDELADALRRHPVIAGHVEQSESCGP